MTTITGLTERDCLSQGYPPGHAAALAAALAAKTLQPAPAAGRFTAPSAVTVPPSSKTVRKWAQSHHVPCPDRGKIPADVMRKYLAAHEGEGRTS
jgi:hypothetical protein